jgi:flagellar assembly protein FliH
MWCSEQLKINELVEPYVYPAVGCAASGKQAADGTQQRDGHNDEPPALREDFERAAVAEQRETQQEAFERGLREGAAQARAECEQALAAERESITVAVRDFARERDAYFRKVEREVVQLALSIARKVLHREAAMDALCLSGVVRVALDKLAARSHVRLRVQPSQADEWYQHFIRSVAEPQSIPEVIGDSALAPGHCVLETEVGTTDLSIDTQVAEIERGFFDLLGPRTDDDPLTTPGS